MKFRGVRYVDKVGDNIEIKQSASSSSLLFIETEHGAFLNPRQATDLIARLEEWVGSVSVTDPAIIEL